MWDQRYVDAPVMVYRDTNMDGTVEEKIYFTQDANFNVTATVDGQWGWVVDRFVYTPYGQRTALDRDWQASTTDFSLGHQGLRLDGETGMYDNRARYYHPTLGRFIQRDPLGYVDGGSLYEYVRSSPILRIDSEGTDSMLWDFISCMSKCMEYNDPIQSFLDKALLQLSGQLVKKTVVAELFELVGDKRKADRIRGSLRRPGVSKWTTIPSSLQLKLRSGGRSSLRALGRVAAPVTLAYNLALAALEVHCAAHCSCHQRFDPSKGGDFTDLMRRTYFGADETGDGFESGGGEFRGRGAGGSW